MSEITEVTEQIEKDVSLQRTITMPLLLFRLCKKYGISISEATQEGALMLLRMNDSFMDCDGSLEEAYKTAPSKYKDKVYTFTSTLRKLSGDKDR
jgi:hypothetical protein